jgi:uncharacterized protein (DUF342 family)
VKNPLEQFFAVEERPDGVYIRLSSVERDSIRIEHVISLLQEAMVLNLDVERLKAAVEDAKGEFECIGPPFEYYNPEFERYIDLSISAQKASLTIRCEYLTTENGIITEQMISLLLSKRGIVHGIKTDAIKSIVEKKIVDTPVVVAEATPPENGDDAVIELKVLVNPEIHPHIRENGSVDYRNIQTFTSVSKDQVLAIKTFPTKGKPGMTITGKPIPALAGKDKQLPRGRNTEIVDDGKALVATKTGIICLDGYLLSVVELLHISGNVDFSVGNIKYSGDVLVNKNVLPGFTIEADGNIHIKGDIESARLISRNGTVTVEKGIIGKNETLVSGKTGVQVSFAQECRIMSEETITVNKYLLHCECICAALDATSAGCSIIGGIIKAENQVSARNVGNERGTVTRITLYDKHKAILEEKLMEIIDLEARLMTELQPIEKALKSKVFMLKRSGGGIVGKIKEEVKKLVDSHNAVKRKISYIQQNKESLRREIAEPREYRGYVRIHGNIFPGTEINLYGSTEHIINKTSNRCFRLNEDNLVVSE